MKRKYEIIFLFLILLIALLLRLYNVNSPYLDKHSWRQVDGAMIAKNFYQNGFNLFKPQVNWFYNEPNPVVELELQITPYLTSFLYLIFGVRFWVGRVFPILFFLISIVYLFKIVKYMHKNTFFALTVSLVYAILPINIFFSRVLMPESLVLMLLHIFIFYFLKYFHDDKNKNKNLFLSILFLTLFLISRLYTLYIYVFIIGFYFWKYRSLKLIFKNKSFYYFLIIPTLILFLVYLLIRFNASRLMIPYDFNYRDSSGLHYWFNFDMLNFDFLKNLFLNFFYFVFTPLGLFLFLFGFFKKRKNKTFILLLLSNLFFLIVFLGSNYIHRYNQLHFTTVISYFMSVGIFLIFRLKINIILQKLIFILVLFILISSSIYYVMPLYKQNSFILEATNTFNKQIELEDESLIFFFPYENNFNQFFYHAEIEGVVITQNWFNGDWVQNFMNEKIEKYDEIYFVFLANKKEIDLSYVSDIYNPLIYNNFFERYNLLFSEVFVKIYSDSDLAVFKFSK